MRAVHLTTKNGTRAKLQPAHCIWPISHSKPPVASCASACAGCPLASCRQLSGSLGSPGEVSQPTHPGMPIRTRHGSQQRATLSGAATAAVWQFVTRRATTELRVTGPMYAFMGGV